MTPLPDLSASLASTGYAFVDLGAAWRKTPEELRERAAGAGVRHSG